MQGACLSGIWLGFGRMVFLLCYYCILWLSINNILIEGFLCLFDHIITCTWRLIKIFFNSSHLKCHVIGKIMLPLKCLCFYFWDLLICNSMCYMIEFRLRTLWWENLSGLSELGKTLFLNSKNLYLLRSCIERHEGGGWEIYHLWFWGSWPQKLQKASEQISPTNSRNDSSLLPPGFLSQGVLCWTLGLSNSEVIISCYF